MAQNHGPTQKNKSGREREREEDERMGSVVM